MRIKLVALLLAASAGTPALIAPAQAQNFREGGVASPDLAREEVAMVQRGERRANRQGNRANRAERSGWRLHRPPESIPKMLRPMSRRLPRPMRVTRMIRGASSPIRR